MTTARFSDFIKPLPNLPHLELPEESALHGAHRLDEGGALAALRFDQVERAPAHQVIKASTTWPARDRWHEGSGPSDHLAPEVECYKLLPVCKICFDRLPI